jgi:hypothetical protein
MELDEIEEIFGLRALYLFVLRDGRDVALSNFQVSWGQRDAHSSARRWVRMLDTVERFGRRIGPDRLLTLRYEDILQTPELAISTLERFLGVVQPIERRTRLMATLAENPRGANYDKWRSKMSPEQLRVFEGVAAGHLASHGYAVVNPDASVSMLEVARFSAGEIVRKVVATVRKDILGRR